MSKKKIVCPEWAKYLVQNCIGDWYCYEFPPVWNDDEGGYYAPDGREKLVLEGDVIMLKEKRKEIIRL